MDSWFFQLKYTTISPKVQQLKLISYKVGGIERIHRRIIVWKKITISPNVPQRTKRRLLNGGERSRPARGPANKTRPKIGGHYRRVTKLGSVIARYDIAGRSHKSPLARSLRSLALTSIDNVPVKHISCSLLAVAGTPSSGGRI